MVIYDIAHRSGMRLTDRTQIGDDGTLTRLPDADAYVNKDGKISHRP